MFKAIWKFCVVQVSILSLLMATTFAITPEEAQRLVNETQAKANAAAIEAQNTVNQNTGVSKDALTSGDVRRVTQEQINQAQSKTPTAEGVSTAAQRQYEIAKNNLEERKADLADAYSGLDRREIKQKEAALASAQSACPGFIPGSSDSDGGYTPDVGTCSSAANRNAIVVAISELTTAKIPNYDRSNVAQARAAVKAAEQTVIAAGHEAQYGAQTAAGAQAIVAAAKEIDASIEEEFKKDAAGKTKEGGIIDLIKKSTTDKTLTNRYQDLGAYNSQLQQDIVMLIIGQVTSRFSACTTAPDIQLGIGAGQAFIVGEVAEYAQAEFLKEKLEAALMDQSSGPYDKQIDAFRTLRSEYQEVLVSAKNKQNLRNLSLTAFYDAAALAAAEAVENESWGVACINENTNKVSRGSNQGGDNIMMYVAMAAAAYAIPYCGGCAAAAVYLIMKGKSEKDKNSCESGGGATAQKTIDRKKACDTLGTDDMFIPTNEPIITASKTIRDRCLADGEAVSALAGKGCQNYSSNGAGPYSACDKATDAYRRNMVSCPVSVLSAGKVATLETSGVTSEEGREFVRKASEGVSRTVDLRMASPRHRIIVWTAFGELANTSVETNKAMIIAIEAQLQKIDGIIAGLEGETKGTIIGKALNTNGPSINTQDILTDANRAINFKNATACLTGTGKNCKSVSSALKSLSGFNNLPFDLRTSTVNVSAGLDTINNTKTLSSGNLSSITKASKEQASIRNSLQKKKGQLQLLASATNSKIELDKESDLLRGDLTKKISKAVGGSGQSIGGAGDSSLFGKGAGYGSGKSDSKDSTGNQVAVVPAMNFDANAGGTGSNYLGRQGSGGVFGDKNSSANAAGQNEEVTDKNHNDNLKLADAISARNKAGKDKYQSNDGQTIFERVTNAYIRNYDKILTKKKDKDLNE